jgi:hypothetical protein
MRSIVSSACSADVRSHLLLYRLDGLYIMTTFTQDIAIADARAPRVGWRGWAALVVLMLPVLLVSVDNTVLSFALPQIALDLEPTATQQLWIIDAYPLVLASLLVTMGVLGDRFGRRRMLLIGATGFGLVSSLAAFAPSAEWLIAALHDMRSRWEDALRPHTRDEAALSLVMLVSDGLYFNNALGGDAPLTVVPDGAALDALVALVERTVRD